MLDKSKILLCEKREVDELGRVVLPMDMRRELNMKFKDKNIASDKDKDEMEIILTSDEYIILKLCKPRCIYTGETKDLVKFEGKWISRKMYAKIKNTEIDTLPVYQQET